MLAPEVGAVIAALPSLGISEDLANELKSFLDVSATELEASRPDQVVSSAFGSAPASVQCAGDAHKARTHVAEALTDMGAALQAYDGVVTDLYKNVTVVDDTAQADMVKKTAQANSCVAPAFSAPSSCALPGNSSEGD